MTTLNFKLIDENGEKHSENPEPVSKNEQI
jgi:hypothetical protein